MGFNNKVEHFELFLAKKSSGYNHNIMKWAVSLHIPCNSAKSLQITQANAMIKTF